MSDVIAAVKVNGETLVYIDYDKPVCQNSGNAQLVSTPSIEHFLVDGILGSCTLNFLASHGVSRHFSMVDFHANSTDVEEARTKIYGASNLKLEYFYYDHQDPLISADASRFNSKIVTTKIDEAAFYSLVKPIR